MSSPLQLLWMMLRRHLKQRLLSEAKRRSLIAYLRIVQGSRRALIGLILGIFVLQLMILAFVGALVSGVWLLDLDTQTKLWILFGTSATLFLLPACLLIYAFSERVWFRASGAEQIVRDLQQS